MTSQTYLLDLRGRYKPRWYYARAYRCCDVTCGLLTNHVTSVCEERNHTLKRVSANHMNDDVIRKTNQLNRLINGRRKVGWYTVNPGTILLVVIPEVNVTMGASSCKLCKCLCEWSSATLVLVCVKRLFSCSFVRWSTSSQNYGFCVSSCRKYGEQFSFAKRIVENATHLYLPHQKVVWDFGYFGVMNHTLFPRT